MKMVNWAIVGVLILFPFYMVYQTEAQMQRKTMITEPAVRRGGGRCGPGVDYER
jgi:hypothetical protein